MFPPVNSLHLTSKIVIFYSVRLVHLLAYKSRLLGLARVSLTKPLLRTSELSLKLDVIYGIIYRNLWNTYIDVKRDCLNLQCSLCVCVCVCLAVVEL